MLRDPRRLLLGCILLAVPLFAQSKPVDVLTQHNDVDRTGHNQQETILTPAAVTKSFGKLFDLEVDAQVYAQPLVVTGLTINKKTRNVVIVATAANTVYYFDADTGESLWSRNFGPPAHTPSEYWPQLQRWSPYRDITPQIGIVSTPVVDRKTNTIYFTSYTEEPSRRAGVPPRWRQWIHALDLVTHADKMGSPVEVKYTYKLPVTEETTTADSHQPHGEGPHLHARKGANSVIVFDPTLQMQRPGLLIVNGRLVLGFASHGDFGDYHGWVFSYDAANLRDTPAVWISTPDKEPDREAVRGGIWQSGMGLTTDVNGAVYAITGNGLFDNKENFGDSILKLEVSGNTIERTSSFTPCDQVALSNADLDLGASGVLHPPGSQFVIGGGKEGILYVLKTADLGGFSTKNGTQLGCLNSNIQQQVLVSCAPQGETGHIHGSPVYWESQKNGAMIYVWCEDDHLRALTWNKTTNLLSPTSCQTSPWPPSQLSRAISPKELHSGMTGGMLSISSNAGSNGILWATTPTNNNANQMIVPGILYAYDADNLQSELWNSYKNRGRDDFGNYAKFTPPTVANGKVYMATFSRRVSVYGLNPPPAPAPPANLLQNGDFEQGTTGWTLSSTTWIAVNNSYPYYGNNAAVLTPNDDGPLKISQTVSAPATGDYHLSAYALTTFLDQYLDPGTAGGTLGVDVNGKTVATQLVPSYVGYLEQTIDFAATAGQSITVWYAAPQLPTDYPDQYQGNTWSNLDVASLSRK